jgi:methylated-DNA-protein-cysteine methyltransferase-like protein
VSARIVKKKTSTPHATALKFLSPAADPPVPWQRVVSSAGKISSRGPGTDGAQRQREALEAEDVEVRVGQHDGAGAGVAEELLVDLAVYGWFPARVDWNGGGAAVEE